MKLKIVSNIDESAWEYEYLLEFLMGDYEKEIYPLNKDTEPIDNSIVIYSCMNGDIDEQNYYYLQKCRSKNYGYYLIHLSNEWGYGFYNEAEMARRNGNLGYNIYTTAKHVWRQYWQPMSDYNHVTTIPLGWKSGFMKASKDYVYDPIYDACFFGQPKGDRRKMLDVMKGLKNGCVSFETAGWNDSKSASIDEQIKGYRSSLISPCPAGGSHPDTFRICEVLEAGGIPVVNNYYGFSYHEKVFGNLNPIPKINNWDDLPILVEKIRNFGPEKLANIVSSWYYSYRMQLKEKFNDVLKQTNYK